jgi:hypothetical protein
MAGWAYPASNILNASTLLFGEFGVVVLNADNVFGHLFERRDGLFFAFRQASANFNHFLFAVSIPISPSIRLLFRQGTGCHVKIEYLVFGICCDVYGSDIAKVLASRFFLSFSDFGVLILCSAFLLRPLLSSWRQCLRLTRYLQSAGIPMISTVVLRRKHRLGMSYFC